MASLLSQIDFSVNADGVEAGIGKAKRAINGLGVAVNKSNSSAAKSIDKYIQRLEAQNATHGQSKRVIDIYNLALRGASNEQVRAADRLLGIADAAKRNDQIFAGLKTGLLAAAAASSVFAFAFARSVKATIDFDDKLNDLSKTTGVSVQDLAGLSLLAQQSGSDLDSLGGAVSKLSKNIGNDPEKFRKLGISAKDPLEALKQLADILVLVEDEQTRAALGGEALGKKYEGAAPALLLGGKAIGEIVKRGTELSGATAQAAANADNLNDQLAELAVVSQRLNRSVAAEATPALIQITKAITDAYVESGKLAAVWTALGALGAFLYTDEFSSFTVKIKTARAELQALEKEQERRRQSKVPEVFVFGRSQLDIAADLIKARDKLASLEKQQADSLKPKDGTVKTPEQIAAEERAKADAARKAKAFIGKESGTSDAKAGLDLELDGIKQSGDAVGNAYANAEKILQARRAANLVDDADYYAARLGFIRLNERNEDDALRKQIERIKLEQSTVQKDSPKDQKESQKKINELEAKRQKIGADAKTQIEINGIAEVAANNAVAQSYVDATTAAQDYLDSVRKKNDSEVDGVGRGNQFRENQSGLNSIEDKRIADVEKATRDRRNGLIDDPTFRNYLKLANETYTTEVALFNDRTQRILTAQADWKNGSSEAFANYIDEAKNAAAQTQQAFTSAISAVEDQLVALATGGKFDFKSLANSITADLARGGVKQLIGLGLEGVRGGALGDTIAGFAKKGTPALDAAKAATDVAKDSAKVAADTAAATAISTASATTVAALATIDAALATASAAAGSFATALAAATTTSAGKSGSDSIGTVVAIASLFSGGGGSGMPDDVPTRGGRALGGPVSSGGLYQVNERGPELLTSGDKTYLMMGGQGGNVSPNVGGSSSTTVLNVSVSPPQGSSRETATQWGAAAGRQMQRAMQRNG